VRFPATRDLIYSIVYGPMKSDYVGYGLFRTRLRCPSGSSPIWVSARLAGICRGALLFDY
jgi:hypothetical protein